MFPTGTLLEIILPIAVFKQCLSQLCIVNIYHEFVLAPTSLLGLNIVQLLTAFFSLSFPAER